MPSHPDRDDDPFLITATLEIRSILRSIQRHAALLRMYVRGDPDHSIMTTVLAFDPETGHVIIDCSPEAAFNQRLVDAPAVVFETQLDHINIQFTARDFSHTTCDDLPALAFPLPEAVRRVQRREFYRVEIPMGEPAACAIPIGAPGESLREVLVKVKDISVGGVRLLDTDDLLPAENGKIYRKARLILPEVGDATLDLDVLRIHTVILPNKKEIIELACRFIDPPKPTTALVQNYIGRLERRLNARRRGF